MCCLCYIVSWVVGRLNVILVFDQNRFAGRSKMNYYKSFLVSLLGKEANKKLYEIKSADENLEFFG